jgi:hypothetical protein
MVEYRESSLDWTRYNVQWLMGVNEFVTSNDKPRIVAFRYIIEASIDVT